MSETEQKTISRDEALERWPNIVAHLICTSLGYFTPSAAAHALACFKNNQPCWCEWYDHMSSFAETPGKQERLLKVGRDVLANAIARRQHHTGYMASFVLAKAAIAAERNGNGPVFASWF